MITFRDQWRIYFHERELRRILKLQLTRKGNSICGDRDERFQRLYKKRQGLGQRGKDL